MWYKHKEFGKSVGIVKTGEVKIIGLLLEVDKIESVIAKPVVRLYNLISIVVLGDVWQIDWNVIDLIILVFPENNDAGLKEILPIDVNVVKLVPWMPVIPL